MPVVPLCKTNTQLEKRKQTKLKSPSHHFICRKGLSVVFEVTMNYWNVYILLFWPIILEQSSLVEKRQKGFSQQLWEVSSCALSPFPQRQVLAALWLSQKWCWNYQRGSWPELLVGSAVFCQLWCFTGALQMSMCCWHLLDCSGKYCLQWTLLSGGGVSAGALCVGAVSSQITLGCSFGPLCCPSAPCTTRYPQPPALPLLSGVRWGNLCLSSSSSYLPPAPPSTEDLLCQGHWGQWVPAEEEAVLGLGGSEVPVREGKDKGSHLCFTLQSGILHGLILPLLYVWKEVM